MGVPNTGGVLRTNIADMKVGDYIAFNYPSAHTFVVGQTATEVPVTGSSAMVGMFWYMIKVDKGLLIGDRVISISTSWDTYNSWDWIQGRTNTADGIPGIIRSLGGGNSYADLTGTNIIPVMTSNTSPSGVASASSEYEAGYMAYKAFDKGTGEVNRWLSKAGGPAWLKYDFGTDKKIVQYTINSGTYAAASPKAWTFEASKTGEFNGEQVTLDSQTNQTGWTLTTRKFVIAKPDYYRFYRINITENNGHTGYFGAIDELEMIETVNYISSTTDTGLGAWPSDNEWDTYIVKKDYGTGAGRDDVWHWNGVFTWCQDTIIEKVNGSTTGLQGFRVRRGYTTTIAKVDNALSSTSNSYTGFRPVFQWDEVTP